MAAARLTFRGKAGDVAWQKQLRDKYLDEGVPEGVDLSLKKAKVRSVSRVFAEQVILKYEWLGTMSTTRLHYGLFFGDYCAGVTCVAVNGTGTAGPNVAMRYGVKRRGLYTLARGANVHWSPTGANSKLVSWTVKMVSKIPDSKIMVAYSDEDAGEIGTIYQACNWNYIGKTKSRKGGEVVSPKGRVANIRMIGGWAKKNGLTYSQMRQLLEDKGWRHQDPSAKGVYVAILDKRDKELVKRIEGMRKPYPKRGESKDSVAADAQSADGGASPTSPLQGTVQPVIEPADSVPLVEPGGS